MKLFWGLLIFVLAISHVFCAMTEAQTKAALKLIRNVCQPKNKATNEQIDGMHTGDWKQDKNGKCYLNCVLNYYKLQLPDNSFNWENGIKVVEAQAPVSLAPFIVAAIQACKESAKSLDDKCESAYEIAKCMYDFNPEKYFLP